MSRSPRENFAWGRWSQSMSILAGPGSTGKPAQCPRSASSNPRRGCVTPVQIANLIEESGGDTDMVDGYDDLPSEYQEKIKFALANGHVEDEDWKGDVECNRPGQKGFRVKVKTPKKKKGSKADEVRIREACSLRHTHHVQDTDEEEPKSKKKRGRPAKEDNDDEAPAPKKPRGKKAAVKHEEAVNSEDEASKPKKGSRGKKQPVYKEESESEAEAKPKVKKATKGKKAVLKREASEDEGEDAEELGPPQPKRRNKKAAAAVKEDKPAPAPQKK